VTAPDPLECLALRTANDERLCNALESEHCEKCQMCPGSCACPPPVRVEVHAEWRGGSADEIYEYDRAEWDAMTPPERAAMLEAEAQNLLAINNATCGYQILGDDRGSDEGPR
jgi:hypothetical protein